MRAAIEVALPFWLDRPDEEATQIADVAVAAGISGLWIGEMATFDAFALAAAIGCRAPDLGLRIGPLPTSVRTPVSIAFGAGSVAALTGCDVDVALGASSPAIVAGWHGRDWLHAAARMRETIECLRPMLRGERISYDGKYVRTNGFRLRHPLPDARIGIGPFGPVMNRLAAEVADEVILNLAAPQRVAAVRRQLDDDAKAVNRRSPHLTVWVPAAVDPGPASLKQVAGQVAVYLAPPGYGEMFTNLGFGELVTQARRGARRAQLADAIPFEMVQQLGAFGDSGEVTARLRAYRDAGADTVAVVPVTADDPAGRAVLSCAVQTLG